MTDETGLPVTQQNHMSTDEKIAGAHWPHDHKNGDQIWYEENVLEAIAQARKEAAQRCAEIVQARLDAYPVDIFPPPSDEDIKAHARLITRNSAAMGRHMAASLLDELREEFNL